MRKPKIIYTKHVRERMNQRNISEKVVRETIRYPNKKSPIYSDDSQEFRKKFGDKTCCIIGRWQKNQIIVITGWWE